MNDFKEKFNYMINNFDEINGFDFYKYIFPNNENKGEYMVDFSKPNAIYLYEEEGKIRKRIMLNDTFENDYCDFIEGNKKALCGGLTYRKNNNKLENAQAMNALIIDLDGVGLNELLNLFINFDVDPKKYIKALPRPTFLVLSGGGVHLYYVFDKPIDLYPNIKLQMKALKYELIFKIWDYKVTSKEKQIQYQSINQSFRMVGSINIKYGNTITAFKIGERVSLDYLNKFVKNKVDINRKFRPSKISKEKAKELYPEWYQRVVIEGNKRLKKWDIKSKQRFALYNWWLNRVGEIKGGHRYFYLMCLAIYACKCDVPLKKLKKDMIQAFEKLQSTEHSNKLTIDDVKSALEAYDREYYNFTINDIEALTDLRIERNKRNGRKQEIHLKLARANQTILDEVNGTNWRVGNGRPKGSGEKKDIVLNWKLNNPTGRKIDCIKATGLSKATVYKWWGYK